MRSTRAKRALLEQSKQVTAKLRDVADGIVASGLLEGGKPGRKLEERYDELAEALRDAYPADGSTGQRRRLDAIIVAGLTPTVDTGEARWKPLHWILEAPDVIHDRDGFDAIIGNPPFLGGKKITGAFGTNYRDWLVATLASGTRGSADLVAYFLLRSNELRSDGSAFGLIATNTIAQGDTKEVGIAQALIDGATIYRAVRSAPWPAKSANLEYAAIWGTNCPVRRPKSLNGEPVAAISAELVDASDTTAKPSKLLENDDIAYNGSILLGKGFVVSIDEGQSWISSDVSVASVVKPYMNGEDFNSRSTRDASRMAIDFGARSEAESARWETPYGRLVFGRQTRTTAPETRWNLCAS